LSPELVDGKPYDSRSDVWAVGVTLFYMMTLSLPFNARSLPELAVQIKQAAIEPVKGRDAQLLHALDLCLVREAAERHSAANVLRRRPALALACRGLRRSRTSGGRRSSGRMPLAMPMPAPVRKFMGRRKRLSPELSPVLHFAPEVARDLRRVRTGIKLSHEAAVRLEAELQECLEPNGEAAPAFDLALVSFAASYRLRRSRFWMPSTAGRLFVTATHLAFVPLLFGRRVAIHIDRIQCLVKLKAWRLLPGAGSSLEIVLNPADNSDGSAGTERVVEVFYAIWGRSQLCRTIQSAGAARDRKLTIYPRRLRRGDSPAGHHQRVLRKGSPGSLGGGTISV